LVEHRRHSVIKPGNYEEGKRYPVLVYYYRFFSQRLHEFNQPAVNHRPSFPLYASNGYVVFLPDVRFEVGRPGFSATKSVVPGVQHLIDIGLADPDAIALHGHSWSGYQTAFVVTQTNIFKTAIAGAPVSNMTSAYSGIRLGSGLARQFQYEMSQSRLSGSLWEARDDYIDNSPVFFADKIETPMLILHGDVDDAVPWEQSIELYLAMRRNGKASSSADLRQQARLGHEDEGVDRPLPEGRPGTGVDQQGDSVHREVEGVATRPLAQAAVDCALVPHFVPPPLPHRHWAHYRVGRSPYCRERRP